MIRLAKPQIPETALQQVREVLKSGNLVQGPHVHKFETALQEYLPARHVMLVSSGTAALHLALLALDIRAGDEVIVPAFTFPATANVVELVGGKLVLVDITLQDFGIDPAKIEAAITEKTKVIIPVHEFGQSADMTPILELARRYKLEVIEDAACALGAECNGQKVGTFGKLGCFSFHPRKAITTGEGGAVVTNDPELAAKVQALRNHGILLRDGKPDFVYAGYNYRLTEFQAVLGLAQFADLAPICQHRRRLADLYDQRLAELDWIATPVRFANRTHVYQTYHVLAAAHIDRDALIASLKASGIETNLGAHAVHCLTYYKQKYGYRETDFPNAFEAYRQGLALPMGDHLHNTEIDSIGRCLRAYKQGIRL